AAGGEMAANVSARVGGKARGIEKPLRPGSHRAAACPAIARRRQKGSKTRAAGAYERVRDVLPNSSVRVGGAALRTDGPCAAEPHRGCSRRTGRFAARARSIEQAVSHTGGR